MRALDWASRPAALFSSALAEFARPAEQIERAPPPRAKEAAPAVEVERLFTKSGGFSLDVSDLKVEAGARVAIIGPNGAGKSTFIEGLLGIRDVAISKAKLLGFPISEWSKRTALRRRMGAQLQRGLFPLMLTPMELIDLHKAAFGNTDPAIAEAFEIEKIGNVVFRFLSPGQKKRVNLCLALIHKPELLVLDEPFATLDRRYMGVTAELLRRYDSGTMLMICHTAMELELAKEIIWLDNGKVEGHSSLSTAMAKLIGGYKVTLQTNTREEAAHWAERMRQQPFVRRVVYRGERDVHISGDEQVRTYIEEQARPDAFQAFGYGVTDLNDLLRLCTMGGRRNG